MDKSTINLLSPKEALNEYFKLKTKYESQINANKKKIINNSTLSKREKRSEFLKLKPKCINCKRPGGTKFQLLYFDENSRPEFFDSLREYRAECGIVADPCPLNIKIQVGKVELLPEILNFMDREIKTSKNKIINDKNKLLFGYLTTDEALKNFDDDKDSISLYSELYEKYLEAYNKIVDNDDEKDDLDRAITEHYILIDEIKECIKKYNDLDKPQYLTDAVEIYTTTLMPVLDKIRMLRYNENMIWHDEDTNSCRLIQNKYSISNMSYSNLEDKVLSFTIGMETAVGKEKKRSLIIEDSSSSEALPNKPLLSKSSTAKGVEIEEIPEDNPIYGKGKDGIAWNIQEYNDLWEKMPDKLKSAIRTNNEWMKKFMHSCVNLKKQDKPCEIITPDELIVPPRVSENGQYDFGIAFYNEVFNKLPETLQETYLTFYTTNDGVKNYKKMIDALNRLVADETDFTKTRGFI
jgi:hypothetical protein